MGGGSSLSWRHAGVVALPPPTVPAGATPALPRQTEVRLLDRVEVRRSDGSVIDPTEWRTRKTLDLFRVLALGAGEPFPVDRLVGLLWPDTDPERGRASLRTAASQIRRVLRYDGIRRCRGGLELQGVWVDVHAFLASTAGCHRAHLADRPADALASAREAELLYGRDPDVGDTPSGRLAEWLGEEQRRLGSAYTTMLVEAGAAALTLGMCGDAADYARRALHRDPYCEQAVRTGMLANLGLGEVEHALALFDSCRDLLRTELGVDPTAQTSAVHLEILRSAGPTPPATVPAAPAGSAAGSRTAGRPGYLPRQRRFPATTVSLSSRRPVPLPLCDRLGIPLSTAPTRATESMLRAVAEAAVTRGDEGDAIEARTLAAGLVLYPRRQFGAARRLLGPASAHPPASRHEALRLLTQQEAAVLLSDTTVELGALDLVQRTAPGLVGLVSGLPIEMLGALARHDRAEPGATAALEVASHQAETADPGGPWRFVAARMLVERGELEQARRLLSGAEVRSAGGPTAQLLALLGRAALAFAEGDRKQAGADLLHGVEFAQVTGATLLLPELASRLVIAGLPGDLEAMIDHLDLAERFQGEVALSRERFTLTLARAAVRAGAGRMLQAAEVAGGAAELAATLGLGHCRSQAQEQRRGHLHAALTRVNAPQSPAGAPPADAVRAVAVCPSAS